MIREKQRAGRAVFQVYCNVGNRKIYVATFGSRRIAEQHERMWRQSYRASIKAVRIAVAAALRYQAERLLADIDADDEG